MIGNILQLTKERARKIANRINMSVNQVIAGVTVCNGSYIKIMVHGESRLERGPIEHSCITAISLDVARALNYLHLMQPHPIIHRDFSSANVLLDTLPNNQWKAKVSDYSSVSLLRELCTVGPGNPVYEAPELRSQCPSQAVHFLKWTSSALELVEMLTNKFPAVEAWQQLIHSINHDEFVHLIGICSREEMEECPSADEIIDKMCTICHWLSVTMLT